MNRYNVLVSNMSTVYTTTRENGKVKRLLEIDDLKDNTFSYKDENGKCLEFEARTSNEAAAKYANKKCGGLNEIICVCSKRIRDPISKGSYGEMTHFDFYKECLEEDKILNRIKINEENEYGISDEPSSDEINNICIKIINHLLDLSKKYEVHLYVDIKGGIREFMTGMIGFFSTLPENIKLEMVIGGSNNANTKTATIKNQINTAKIFSLYSGIEEFLKYGRCDKLEEYYQSMDNKNPLLDVIKNISDAFLMCNSVDIIENIIKLYDELKNSTDEADDFEKYIKKMIEDAYNDLFETFKTDENKDYIHNFEFIKKLISFCLNHHLIQQALTIYCECIPYFFVEEKIIYPYDLDMLKGIYEKILVAEKKKKAYKDELKRYSYEKTDVNIINKSIIEFKQWKDNFNLYFFNYLTGKDGLAKKCKEIDNIEGKFDKDKIGNICEDIKLIKLCINKDLLKTDHEKNYLKIYEDYFYIKYERNLANHAFTENNNIKEGTEKAKEKFKTINDVIDYMKEALNRLD